jgi:hypothetical protein
MGSLPRTAFSSGLTFLALFSSSSLLYAQDTPPPAHIAVVDGTATLERENSVEAATAGVPVIPGDRLRTSGGRVELLFADGSALDVDEYATVDVQSDTLVRLVGGRVLLTVAGAGDPSAALRYQVDTPVASARNEGPGEYRVAVLNGPAGLEGELAVLRGAAYLTTENGSMLVRAGERSLARDNSSPSAAQIFNSARFDAFDQWASARRADRLGTAASAQYLPRDLQSYGGTLDRNGLWQYESPYGYVWYPTVAPGWRPYYNGYWASVRPYGWTWIGLDLWGWPTHHYGRWGVSRNRWFWIPERRWSAAWVSWAAAPGYVSWCPLGFDNRPVFALTIASGNPWAGWVLLPRSHFGAPGRIVRQYAVASPSLSIHAPLVVQATAPVPIQGRAVPRQTYSQRDATIAIPRGSAAAAGPPAPGHAIPRGGAAASTAIDLANQAAAGRAVPRQRAPAELETATPPSSASPIFKLPLSSGARQRPGESRSAAGASVPTPSSPIASPGTRPYGGRDRAFAPPASALPAPSQLPGVQRSPSPSMPSAARRFEARPRSEVNPLPAPQFVPARPSSAMPPRAVPSPASPSGSPSPAAAPAGARANARSAPAQSGAPQQSGSSQSGSSQSSSSQSGSAQSGSPAGARAPHRR